MKFADLFSAAANDSGYLNDKDIIKIYISPSPDNPPAEELKKTIIDLEKESDNVKIIFTGSTGYYNFEPLMMIGNHDQYVLYNNINTSTVNDIISNSLNGSNTGQNALFSSGPGISGVPGISDLPYMNIQKRNILRNAGFIDPENIYHYVMRGGYSGLSKILKMKPREIIDAIKDIDLRDRGWNGNPVAGQWNEQFKSGNDEKYVICNAVDFDEKSRTAGLLLTSDPHSALEGMLVAAYATGAEKAILCIEKNNAYTRNIINKAILQMNEYGLYGSNILDSDFNCELEIKEVDKALIIGEETALISVLEGKQAIPFLKNDEQLYYNGNPAIINNIETFSNISYIFQNESPEHKGTKIITASNESGRTFTAEIPLGMSIRAVADNIIKKIFNKAEIKAIQFGGPAGALNKTDDSSIIDYPKENIWVIPIGSGTLSIYNNKCAVDIAREITEFLHSQSCGKCVFCREGLLQLAEILNDIHNNNASAGDMELMEEIAENMKTGSICVLGKTASIPVLSCIDLFGEEFDSHIKNKKCPADN